MTTLTLEPCCLAAIQDAETGDDPATCVFGCGYVVDSDTKMCLKCRDHSAPATECRRGHRLEQWGDDWERMA